MISFLFENLKKCFSLLPKHMIYFVFAVISNSSHIILMHFQSQTMLWALWLLFTSHIFSGFPSWIKRKIKYADCTCFPITINSAFINTGLFAAVLLLYNSNKLVPFQYLSWGFLAPQCSPFTMYFTPEIIHAVSSENEACGHFEVSLFSQSLNQTTLIVPHWRRPLFFDSPELR